MAVVERMEGISEEDCLDMEEALKAAEGNWVVDCLEKVKKEEEVEIVEEEKEVIMGEDIWEEDLEEAPKAGVEKMVVD